MKKSEIRMDDNGDIAHHIPLPCVAPGGKCWPVAAEALVHALDGRLPLSNGETAELHWDGDGAVAVYVEKTSVTTLYRHDKIVEEVRSAWSTRLGEVMVMAAAIERMAREGAIKLTPQS